VVAAAAAVVGWRLVSRVFAPPTAPIHTRRILLPGTLLWPLVHDGLLVVHTTLRGGGSSGGGGSVGGDGGFAQNELGSFYFPSSSHMPAAVHVAGRGLHSSTFRLNLSALYGIEGGARSDCIARV